jgi:hypothetical protein
MGAAYGAIFFISCIGMGLGSFAGGAIHDPPGSYQALFLGSAAITLMAVVLGVTLKAPAPVMVPRPSPAPGGCSGHFPLTGRWFFVKNRPPFRAYLTTRLASL